MKAVAICSDKIQRLNVASYQFFQFYIFLNICVDNSVAQTTMTDCLNEFFPDLTGSRGVELTQPKTKTRILSGLVENSTGSSTEGLL